MPIIPVFGKRQFKKGLKKLGGLITTRLKLEIERFHALRSQVLHQEYLDGNLNQFDHPQKDPITNEMAKAYLLHVLKAGTSEERQLTLSAIKTKFILRQRELQLR